MANQSLRPECALPNQGDQKVRIQNKESALATRLREAIGDEPVVAFGRRCGLNESTLRKYFYGTLPNIENLVAMADAANVNIEWLATGRGPKMRGAPSIPMIPPAPLLQPSLINVDDLERLELAIESVEEGLRATRRTMEPPRYAQLVVAVYDLLADMDQKDNVLKFIKLAA